ncbi:MAG TPA: hypothetical protein VFR21_03630 [Bradyrhizobium sp.]|jgi:hypothetical protein|nr:hypothetical protein [Bradyrhizobium sp.]
MVPYVDDEELIYVLLREIARGNLDRALVDLIADPAVFFPSRGAARVTFLNGGPPGEPGEPEGPEPPDPGEPTGDKDDRGWVTRISRPIAALTAPVWARSTAGPSRVGIIDGGTCVVTIARGSVGLRLKPYRAAIAQSARQQLLADARALVGPPPSSSAGRPDLRGLAYAIAQHARAAKGRAELRALHKKHAGSSNRASLSLLSEPFNFDPAHAYWHVSHPSRHYPRHGGGAWMNTGDAELLAPGDLAGWRNCYWADVELAGEVMVRHGQWILKFEWNRVKLEAASGSERRKLKQAEVELNRDYGAFVERDGSLHRLDAIGAGKDSLSITLLRSEMDVEVPATAP